MLGVLAFAYDAYASVGPMDASRLPDSTPLIQTQDSSLQVKLDKNFGEASGYEWSIKEGKDPGVKERSPDSPYCLMQVARIRGISLQGLKSRTLDVDEVSPFQSRAQAGANPYQRGAFIALSYRDGKASFSGKLTCFNQSSKPGSMTLGEVRKALRDTMRIDSFNGDDGDDGDESINPHLEAKDILSGGSTNGSI